MNPGVNEASEYEYILTLRVEDSISLLRSFHSGVSAFPVPPSRDCCLSERIR